MILHRTLKRTEKGSVSIINKRGWRRRYGEVILASQKSRRNDHPKGESAPHRPTNASTPLAARIFRESRLDHTFI